MAVRGYWGPRGPGYYYDPMLLEADCGASVSRESAVAALMALSRELSVGVGGVVLALLFSAVFIAMSIIIMSAISFVGGIFTVIPLMFALFGVGVTALIVWRASRMRQAARAIQELAHMVQNGLLRPEEVCGKNVATLLELHKLKAVPGAVPAPLGVPRGRQ